MDNKQQILQMLSSADLDVMNYVKIFPSTCMAKRLNLSLYKTRKLLKELKEEGVIESSCDAFQFYSDEPYVICRGYILTDKGRLTSIYEKEKIRENAIFKEVWGFE